MEKHDDDVARQRTAENAASMGISAKGNEKAASFPELEQLLADYRAAEDADRGFDWYWCDQIEDRIGRERYREIMFGPKPETKGVCDE